MDLSNQFIVICGPSGSGKSMTASYLLDTYGFVELPFLTTRELRPGEAHAGSHHLTRHSFVERSLEGTIFLGVRSYGNAYGYDLDVVYRSAIEGKRIVLEAPSSYLATDVAYFLPQAILIGIIPLSTEAVANQLFHRGLNKVPDQRLRLLNCEIEKEHIASCCALMDITIILPTEGDPEPTLRQIDRVMKKHGFSQHKEIIEACKNSILL